MTTSLTLAQEVIARALREARTAPWLARVAAVLFVHAIMTGDHARLRRQVGKLARFSRGGELYFLALSHFLTGDHEFGLTLIDQIPTKAIDPADVAILKAQILDALGRKQEAWQTLDHAAQSSQRLKLYSALADLVQTAEDFAKFERTVKQGCDSGIISATLPLVDYRLKAALRARQYEFALQLATQDYRRLVRNPMARSKTIRPGTGEVALAHLNAAVSQGGNQFFLISGTLLGAIREGRILPHDNDLDVGLWAEDDLQTAKAAIAKSGYFYCLPQRSPWMMRVRHVNGVAIDIFRHFRNDTYWHGGVKAKWHNSPFNLQRMDVLGGNYLVPENFEHYLTENYGNWKQKILGFDSVFHTPNAEIINDYECAIHCIKKISALELDGKPVDHTDYSRFLQNTFDINLPPLRRS